MKEVGRRKPLNELNQTATSNKEAEKRIFALCDEDEDFMETEQTGNKRARREKVQNEETVADKAEGASLTKAPKSK